MLMGTAFAARRVSSVRACRQFSTSFCALEKRALIGAIAELRKAVPGTSLTAAREALTATMPDAASTPNVKDAIQWLENQSAVQGQKREAKVASRTTNEGTVAVCTLSDGLLGASARAAIIELNCETDFVARNQIFGALARDIAHTAAWFPIIAPQVSGLLSDVDLAAFLECPIMPYEGTADDKRDVKTVRATITEAVAQLGEKIALTRVASLSPPDNDTVHVCGSFAHGTAAQPPKARHPDAAPAFASGRIASLLAVQVQGSLEELAKRTANADDARAKELRALVRSIARQAAGFPTQRIRSSDSSASENESGDSSTVLLDQPFAMLLPAAGLDAGASEGTVRECLRAFSEKHEGRRGGVRVASMRRWEVGETAEPQGEQTSFADQVKEAAGMN